MPGRGLDPPLLPFFLNGLHRPLVRVKGERNIRFLSVRAVAAKHQTAGYSVAKKRKTDSIRFLSKQLNDLQINWIGTSGSLQIDDRIILKWRVYTTTQIK